MEKVIHYKFSKSIDKSLSYLSGVGYDLSFDITYYLRLSICATRYCNGALFLNKNIITDINKQSDFGEPGKISLNEKEDADFVHREIVNGVFTHEFVIGFNKQRQAPMSILCDTIHLSNYKYVDEANKPILLEPLYQHNMEKYNNQIRIALNKKEMVFTNAIIADKHNKSGIDVAETFKSVGSKGYGDISSTEDISVREICNTGTSITEQLVIELDHRAIYIEDIIGSETLIAEIIVDQTTAAETPTSKLIIPEDNTNIGKTDTLLNYLSSNEFTESSSIELHDYDNGVEAHSPTKEANSDDTCEQLYNNKSGTDVFTHHVIELRDRGLNDIDEATSVGISDKGVLDDDSLFPIGVPSKGIFEHQYTGVGTPKKSIFSHSGEPVGKPSAAIEDDQKIEYLGKTSTGIDSQFDALHILKDDAGLTDIDYEVNVSIIGTGIFSLDETLNISKFSSEITYDHMLVNLHHMPRQLTDVEANVFFMQKGNVAIFSISNINTDKSSKRLFNTDDIRADRIVDYSTSLIDIDFGRKYSKGMYSQDGVIVFKNNLRNAYDNVIEALDKNTRSLKTDDSLFMNRPSAFGILSDEPYSFSKMNKNVTVNGMYEYTSKTEYNAFCSEDYFDVSKLQYDTFVDGDTFGVDKEYVDASPDVSIINLEKVMRNTQGGDLDFPVSKSYRYTEATTVVDFILKNYKDTDLLDTSKGIKVPSRGIRPIDTSVLITPMAYKIDNTEDTTIVPRYRITGVEEIIINFTRYYHLDEHDYLSAERPKKFSSRVYDADTAKRHDLNYLNINETIGTTCDPYETIVEESGDSFAYTDKPDYALIKDDRIDELELPPTDFNYSTFAKKLLGDDGQIDRKYIKGYDDSTGGPIVTLPIENPIKYFSDLAVHYIDLNVGMLTYIIEKAYNIWQSNIFLYSAMSSNGALNDILIKLKNGLFIQYPSEKDQEHLHRAIRLFRWYAEMSILNNADYMLKLNYKDLSVDYANKKITDFSTVSTITNMHIDASYVLSPIDNTKSSEIVIAFDRSHKTRIVFDLAVSDGNCTVTINGKTTTYANEFVSVDSDLLIGENEIRIKFTPGASPLFNIMRLAIKQYAIKSYKVIYIGKIGETNKTVNHLITMLSVCGDSIDNIQRTVAHSMPTVQALDQLRVYFNLHHEDKLKGKRLVTKH